MPFIPLSTFFPDLVDRETRTITILDESLGVPLGQYVLWENYCNDEDCDCRKVIINMATIENNKAKIWATISFGWEEISHYKKWAHGHMDSAKAMLGSYLEPLGEQSKYASKFLEIWKGVIEDDNYVERLQRHYKIFKEKI